MVKNPIKDDTNKPKLKRSDDVMMGGQRDWETGDQFDDEAKSKDANPGIDKKFWNKRSDGPGLSFQPGEGPKDDDGFSFDAAKKGTGGKPLEKGFLKPGGLAENDEWPDEDYFYDCAKDGKFGS